MNVPMLFCKLGMGFTNSENKYQYIWKVLKSRCEGLRFYILQLPARNINIKDELRSEFSFCWSYASEFLGISFQDRLYMGVLRNSEIQG